jgi:adenylate kinase
MKFQSFLIFGPPGAGKGTIGKLLCQAANLVHISSGDIFRGLSPNSPAGQLAAQYLSKGQLLPDEVTIQIWRAFVDELVLKGKYNPEQQLLLLDGLPRTAAQAKALEAHTDVRGIIVLEVKDEKELLRRLARRASIEGRSDDADSAVLENRMKVYKEQTAQVLEHYPKEKIQRFNAQQPVPCVLRDVLVGVAEKLSF